MTVVLDKTLFHLGYWDQERGDQYLEIIHTLSKTITASFNLLSLATTS